MEPVGRPGDERLDDLGIDLSVVYPTAGLSFHRQPDTKMRRAICRAYNVFTAEQFGRLEDRILPAAILPMYTPEEALEELEFTVKQLGYKVVMVGGLMRRPVPALAEEHPDASRFVEWYDVIGLDSEHDYDPVWARCMELGVAATFHALGRGPLRPRGSVSNQVYNRVGSFGLQHHRLASALFLGGVTRRFPDLNIAFLEGGVAWACTLYSDLVGIWSKRNTDALTDLDPENLDQQLFFGLVEKYGDATTVSQLGEVRDRRLAGRTPGCPIVDQHYTTTVICESLSSSRQAFK